MSGSLFILMIERGLCFGCIAEATFVCYILGVRNTSIDFFYFHFYMILV